MLERVSESSVSRVEAVLALCWPGPPAALVCTSHVANTVLHLLYDNSWGLGKATPFPPSFVAFQLNVFGMRALLPPASHPILAPLLADASVRLERLWLLPFALPPLSPSVVAPLFSFVELFAGIGGFRLACDALGGRCVAAVELNREARQTYAANFGAAALLSAHDVRLVRALPPHSVLTAGFPCQSFTSAGEARGFQDANGMLFFEVVRLLCASQPPYFVLENVPNLLNVDDGVAIEVVVAALVRAGYRVSHRVLDGGLLLAQSRKRLFLVGWRHDVPAPGRGGDEFPWPELPELGLTWADIEDDPGTAGSLKLTQAQRAAMRHVPLVQRERKIRTVMASYKRSHRMHSQFVSEPDGTERFMSPREVARAQGFPHDFVLDACLNPNAIYSQLGNAVPPPLACAVVAALLGRDTGPAIDLARRAVHRQEEPRDNQ